MTYFSESPRNVVRGEDRKEIAGSTTIFSDLTTIDFEELTRSVETPRE